MATLNTIYRISADISDLQQKVTQGVATMDRLAKKNDDIIAGIKKLGSAVGIGFGVREVISFANEIIHTADEITKLSDQTGVSVEWLQKFQIAADDAGNTVDDLAMAISKMQRNLASGDHNAVAAIKDLHLALADLRAMAPHEQFMAIAEAIAAIPDPAKQADAAVAIFGRNGATLLPTMKRGFDDVKNASVAMSGDTVAVLDTFGDALTKTWRTASGLGGRMLAAAIDYYDPFIREATAARAAQDNFKHAMDHAPALAVAAPFSNALPDAQEMITINAQLERGLELSKQARIEAEKLAELRGKVHEVEAGLFAFPEALEKIGRSYDDAKLGPLADSLARVEQNAHIANFGFKGMVDDLASVGQAVVKTTSELSDFAEFDFVGPVQEKLQSLKGFLQNDLGKVILGAFQGGGNVGRSIGGAIGGFLTGPMSAIGNTIGGLVSKIGGGIGTALNSILPVVGTLFGGLAGSLFGKLFSNPEKEINPIRQAFVNAAGGLQVLNQRAHEAGITLDHLLNAKNPEQYKRAIEELNTAFEFQDQAVQTLQSTIAKYHFTAEERGPALALKDFDEAAKTLYQDWRILTAAQIDSVAIGREMQAGINDFVHTALKMGYEVPLAMQPMLQKMVDMGLLTDEAGNVITDLKTSGITFAESMSAGFSRVVASVDALTAAIGRFLGITNQAANAVVNFPSFGGGGEPGGDIPRFAEGGPVKRTGLIFAHAGEFVQTPNQRAAFLGGPGGEHITVVQVDGREIARVARKYQDRDLLLKRKLNAA